jgi:microsomal dipeptidase-like Zn-dependent dipeptidase
MNTGFTPLGLKVVRTLLDRNDGKRIYIDIKHMSPESRKSYFEILDSEYQNEDIPIIVSHGAVNGLRSMSDRTRAIQSTAGKFREVEINFFDEEIVKIARSNGIFCLQLDERRVASEAELKNAAGQVKRREIFYYRSRLLWHQIQHIVEILDQENLFAWGLMAFGSDFDGIIDPLNGFWTAEELPFLEENLSKHAFNYMSDEGQNLKNDFNKIKPTEIVSRIMCDNGLAFLERYFTNLQAINV